MPGKTDVYKRQVYGTRLNSPLLAAVGEGEGFLASDISAVLQYTKHYYALEHGEIVTILPDGTISICTMEGVPVQKELLTAQWDVEQAQKNGYEHFMRKEIFEQPTALYNTCLLYTSFCARSGMGHPRR